MAPMIFGVFVPQGWKMELASIDDPQDKWAKAVEIARLADELAYDSIWVYDHFHNVPVPAHEAMFECWTTIAALSQVTSRVRLGQMVGCALYRNPALLAKITSNIDVMSGGRLDWGIGAGWYEHEYKAYGYGDEFWRGRASDGAEAGTTPDGRLPAAKDRIAMLRETVEIVKLCWSEPDADYTGRFFEVHGAQCDPKPVQQPHPPIWIGGGGEQLTLRVVARYADRSNFGGKPHEWKHKAEVLKGHCAAVGRDYDELTKTWSPEVFIREDEQEILDGGSRSFWGEPFDSWREGNLVGTPEQVCEKLRAYQALGLGGVVAWPSDFPDTQTVRLFAEQVIPEFR
jgi:alkanesulfonate monooxygenase SsuD/methylene tetrahydromethanopterin reductase-like flavin-dependent oxidoreductase (luciferase family)